MRKKPLTCREDKTGMPKIEKGRVEYWDVGKEKADIPY